MIPQDSYDYTVVHGMEYPERGYSEKLCGRHNFISIADATFTYCTKCKARLVLGEIYFD